MPIHESDFNQIKEVRGYNYSKVNPEPLNDVSLGIVSESCMKWIGLKVPDNFKATMTKEEKNQG